jgi:hypothetical protein
MISLLLFETSPGYSQQSSAPLKIWFTKPADNWNEALPVG